MSTLTMQSPEKRARWTGLLAVAALILALALPMNSRAQDAQTQAQAFETPEAAAAALIAAVKAKERDKALAILGQGSGEWITSGDPVQDAQARERFLAAYDEKNAIEKDGDTQATLVVGEDGFPFPIPLLKADDGWAFDAELGREEILDRRIGENELNTIQVLLAIADAQLDYASRDWDGDGLRSYASRFRSSEGKRDGLYWPTDEGEALSPLGPLVAQASKEGYTEARENTEDGASTPYHGYRFKLLKRQGDGAEGGAYDYLVGDDMVGGFAVLAYPTKYGASGIMTFIVNHDGTPYEADLGPETESIVGELEAYNPDDAWKRVALE